MSTSGLFFFNLLLYLGHLGMCLFCGCRDGFVSSVSVLSQGYNKPQASSGWKGSSEWIRAGIMMLVTGVVRVCSLAWL